MKIVTVLETIGVLPDGFFQRFIIKLYCLNIFKDCMSWNHGFKALTKDGDFICQHEKSNRSSRITLIGSADPDNIYHLWTCIIPVLRVSSVKC